MFIICTRAQVKGNFLTFHSLIINTLPALVYEDAYMQPWISGNQSSNIVREERIAWSRLHSETLIQMAQHRSGTLQHVVAWVD